MVTVALAALGLAACSSSGAPATTTTTTAAPTTTTLPPLSSSKAAIDRAYSVLFDLSNPALAPKIAVIQNGSALESAMKAALKSSLAKLAAGADVSAVTVEEGAACKGEFLPSPCAKVTYSIVGADHKVLLGDSVGFAIYHQPDWLVAKGTICTLLSLENGGKQPPGC
jgi:hypothetical protein